MDPPSTFPQLEVLDAASGHTFIQPAKRIHDGADVNHFLRSQAYRDIGIFILQLNRALCPRKPPTTGAGGEASRSDAASNIASETFSLDSKRNDSEVVKKLRALLEKTAAIIDEAPPDPGPRRFGNISFRRWHEMLESRTDELLREHLPSELLGPGGATVGEEEATAFDELRAYFLGAFGSAQRLDYGTGHELSFVAFLGCMWKLGLFKGESQDGEVERSISLGVIEPYLKVIRKLILTYTLEPAGSHGVWGLDDHSFIPYILGSAQYTRPISANEPMPLEGSVRGAPKPSDVTKPEVVERLREVNMYFSAIGFISDVKKGPFWEHSPILYDISGIKDGWGKINKGMIKMFNAEVLGKFPVVQHFPFGSLFSWDEDSNAAAPTQSIHIANQPTAPLPGTVLPLPLVASGTAAPWTQSTKLPPATGGGTNITQTRSPGPVSRAPQPDANANSRSREARRLEPSLRDEDLKRTLSEGKRGTAGAQFAFTKAPWAK